MIVNLLTCKDCGKTNESVKFYSFIKCRCSACENKRRKLKYHSNPEHRAKRLKNNMVSRLKNGRYLNKRKAYDQKYVEANPEKVKQSKKRWDTNNAERVRMKVRRRRERQRQLEGHCTADQWIDRMRFHGNRCYYCKRQTKLTMDHRIPISRGGYAWPSNLVPACLSCNSQKRDMTEKEFREWRNENRS